MGLGFGYSDYHSTSCPVQVLALTASMYLKCFSVVVRCVCEERMSLCRIFSVLYLLPSTAVCLTGRLWNEMEERLGKKRREDVNSEILSPPCGSFSLT